MTDSAPMRILFCCQFYAPSVGGVQEVVRQLAEQLALRGNAVTIATTALPDRDFDMLNGVRVVEFAAAGNAVEGMSGDIAGSNVLWSRATLTRCWFVPHNSGPSMPCGQYSTAFPSPQYLSLADFPIFMSPLMPLTLPKCRQCWRSSGSWFSTPRITGISSWRANMG